MIKIRETEEIPLSVIIDSAVPNVLTKKESTILNRCQKISLTSYMVENDGKLLCVWGVIPPSILSTEVYLWLHVTPHLKSNPFTFVRHSQLVVEKLLKEYEAIVGHVKNDAPHSRRWLKWLGATFGRPTGPLTPFRIERKWPIQ